MTPEFWAAKKVLVTGHTGFKGGWLCLWLQRLGAEVVGYALPPPTRPSLFEVARVGLGMRSVEGDLRDLSAVVAAIATAQPELVIHMGAQALVRPSYLDPVETYATNVLGTVNVLEGVRRARGVRAVVVVTSDKSYENREVIWGYRESDPMGGHDPYSSSKGCAELIASAYRRSFFSMADAPALATVRAGNAIGGGDWAPDRLVPDIVRAWSSGTAARIRNPGSVRPWQHVLDPLAGYLMLAQKLLGGSREFADAWNFGPNDVELCNVTEIADLLAHAWGEGADWRADAGAPVHEAGILKLDSSKARARLGWRPRLELREAIDWTAEWYRADLGSVDMRALTLAQIERFEGRSGG